MENLQTTQAEGTQQKRSKKPVVIVCILLGALLAAYLVVCGIASGSKTFYPNYTINGVAVGGLTEEEAQTRLEQELPAKKVTVRVVGMDDPVAEIRLSELGYTKDSVAGEAQSFLIVQREAGFLSRGWEYLSALTGNYGGGSSLLVRDEDSFDTAVASLTAKLTVQPVDSSFTLGGNSVSIVKSSDGHSVDAQSLSKALNDAVNEPDGGYEADIEYIVLPAKSLTAQEIYDECAAEVKNAGYDAATGEITPEQIGAEFDVNEAKSLLDSAAPGETVEVPATIEHPAVTAEQLRSVLFRDVLGTARTHVGGSSARISNVKLASSSVNGTILNSGDVFSYNGTVGQRTESKGYQAAPAYVQGETVDEIGGGVCQPSSTLYLACLNANLEITERYAHRYVPAYIAKGMDATVSWDGPDYKFTNDTNYPIKIVATYSGGYLTMKLLGTKEDSTYVKMTNKVLSTTEWKTVTQDDSTIPAGTQQVKVTPYTGYKVETYRNVYSSDGSLITSKLEDVSNYKVRDKLILVGPKKAEETVPSGNTSSVEIPVETPVEKPTETPVQPPVEKPVETPVHTPTDTGDEGYGSPAA